LAVACLAFGGKDHANISRWARCIKGTLAAILSPQLQDIQSNILNQKRNKFIPNERTPSNSKSSNDLSAAYKLPAQVYGIACSAKSSSQQSDRLCLPNMKCDMFGPALETASAGRIVPPSQYETCFVSTPPDDDLNSQ
jgi:hypothetical protein